MARFLICGFALVLLYPSGIDMYLVGLPRIAQDLGASEAQYTHGTSAQRMTWFRRGFDSGDARQCDTFAVRNYNQL